MSELPFDTPPGAITPDEMIASQMPKDVAEWWSGLRVVGDFTIELERAKGSGAVELLPPVSNRIPSQAEIGEQYGPGRYRMIVTYHPATWKEGKTDKKPGPWFELSEDGYADLHEDFLTKRADRKAARKGSQSPVAVSQVNPIEGLVPLIQTVVQSLRPAQAPPPQDNSVLVALIQSMNQQSASQMQMFMQMQQQTTQLIVNLVSNKKEEGTGLDGMFDKFFGLMEKSMDIRDRLMVPPKEEASTLDRLMDGVGQLLPHLGTLLGMNPTMRRMVVPGVIASQPQEVQNGVKLLQADAEFREKVIARTREAYGDKADEVIEALNLVAPLGDGEKV